MKIKAIKLIIPLILVILVVLTALFMLNNLISVKKKDANILLLPSLPKPIAQEYALITSAGQDTDAYIVYDAANKLMIHNYFMPQAEGADLEGVNTLVFAVGDSSLGQKLHGTSYEEEEKRVSQLVDEAKREKLVIVTVYVGGQSRDKNTDKLLRLVVPESNYLIATKEANKDGFLSDMVRADRIPVTLINSPKDLSEPFASAFR